MPTSKSTLITRLLITFAAFAWLDVVNFTIPRYTKYGMIPTKIRGTKQIMVLFTTPAAPSMLLASIHRGGCDDAERPRYRRLLHAAGDGGADRLFA